MVEGNDGTYYTYKEAKSTPLGAYLDTILDDEVTAIALLVVELDKAYEEGYHKAGEPEW